MKKIQTLLHVDLHVQQGEPPVTSKVKLNLKIYPNKMANLSIFITFHMQSALNYFKISLYFIYFFLTEAQSVINFKIKPSHNMTVHNLNRKES